MEVYPQASILLIISEPLTGYKRCPMKGLCVICCGRTQMIDADGVYHQEELGILLGRTFQKLSTIIMV
jgi:hypothetical protein